MEPRNEELVTIMKMGKGKTEVCWCAYEYIHKCVKIRREG